MMNRYTIRKAEPSLAVAADLLSVEGQSLGDSAYTPAEIYRVLRRPEQYAYIAYLDDMPVGFCSCIETPANRGKRLEIDMLGVAPAHRRRGLGKMLVAHSVRQAAQRDVVRFRAIVALDNVASRRTFRRAGFDPSQALTMIVYRILGRVPVSFLPKGWTCHLAQAGAFGPYGEAGEVFNALGWGHEVCRLTGASGETVAMAECLRVCTMAYKGLWLERLWARDTAAYLPMARALVERAKILGLDEVGCLVPQKDAREQLLSFMNGGYSRVGEYIRFEKALGDPR